MDKNIVATVLRDHRSQFCGGQRAEHGNKRSDHPGQKNSPGTPEFCSKVPGRGEDSSTDHGRHHQNSAGKETDFF